MGTAPNQKRDGLRALLPAHVLNIVTSNIVISVTFEALCNLGQGTRPAQTVLHWQWALFVNHVTGQKVLFRGPIFDVPQVYDSA